MAEDTQCLCVKRWSCKACITKLLTKVDKATSCKLSVINSEVVTDSRRLVFTTTLAQLKVKKDVISELNDNISAAIKNEDELESELTDADLYLTELEEKIAIMAEFIMKASQPPVIRDVSHTLTPHPPSLAATVAPPMPETEVVKKPIHTTNVDSAHVSDELVNLPINTSQTAQDTSHTFSRLPKLTLPTFNGSPLQWQIFWTHLKLE